MVTCLIWCYGEFWCCAICCYVSGFLPNVYGVVWFVVLLVVSGLVGFALWIWLFELPVLRLLLVFGFEFDGGFAFVDDFGCLLLFDVSCLLLVFGVCWCGFGGFVVCGLCFISGFGFAF